MSRFGIRSRVIVSLGVVGLMPLLACNDGRLPLEEDRPGAVFIELAPGETGERVAMIEATVAPYRVLARDHLGQAVPDARVAWIGDGGFHPRLSSSETTTDADGIAEVTHILGRVSGEERVHAVVPGLVGSPVVFRATVLPGPPAGFLTQWRTPPAFGTPFSERTYRLGVHDRYHNWVPGVPVEFSVIEGTGTVDPGRSATGPGRWHDWAVTTHRLGPEEGMEIVSATPEGAAGSPNVTFSTRVVTALSTVARGEGFHPAVLSVPAGKSVAWLWSVADDPYGYCELSGYDCTLHNVVFDDNPSEPVSSATRGFGDHFRTFHEAGTYTYRCTIHGSVGTVHVLPPS